MFNTQKSNAMLALLLLCSPIGKNIQTTNKDPYLTEDDFYAPYDEHFEQEEQKSSSWSKVKNFSIIVGTTAALFVGYCFLKRKNGDTSSSQNNTQQTATLAVPLPQNNKPTTPSSSSQPESPLLRPETTPSLNLDATPEPTSPIDSPLNTELSQEQGSVSPSNSQLGSQSSTSDINAQDTQSLNPGTPRSATPEPAAELLKTQRPASSKKKKDPKNSPYQSKQ
jgi:hypothetical protein